MKPNVTLHPLTAEEKRVILNKGTERPFSGSLLDEKHEGTFLCKQCHAPLYYSDMKFDSWCGRPSFDDAIPGQVHEETDADGHRTEITCLTCGGHLGHVFRGEHITAKNTRHCVNSVSLTFVPEKIPLEQFVLETKSELATFWWWCYWCLEAVFQRLKWVLLVESWFMWGESEDPSYEEVCDGRSWHVEVVQIHFDPQVITYQTLLNVFFTSHDPTQLNRQWADIWTQYASVIFTHSPEQKALAQQTIDGYNTKKIFAPDTVVTDVRDATEFRKAPWYQKDYYNTNLWSRYCTLVISPKVKHLREQWQDLLKDEYEDEEVYF